MSTDRTDQRARRMMSPTNKELPALPADIDITKANLLSVHANQEPKSAASSVRSGVSSSGSSSIDSCAETREPYMGPHGWVLPSRSRHRSVSRSSMASATSFRTDETPLTPMSNPYDAVEGDTSGLPELSQLEIKHESEPRPLGAVPFRPKHTGNRESWDSALGSDFSGRRRRHVPSTSMSATSDYCSILSLSLEDRRPALDAEPVQGGEASKYHPVKEEGAHAAEIPDGAVDESDSDETVSDGTVSNETIPSGDAAGRVLNYTLDVAFGLAIDNVAHVPSTCRSIVDNFISDMSWAVDKELGHKRAPAHTCTADLSRLPTNASTSSSGNASSQRSSTGSDKGKRKSRDGGEDDQDGDDECDDKANKRRDSSGPSKRAKLDALRMSCPFRKKNPLRFNVRDYRLCALTVFTDTAELRRHIQDVHKRPVLSHHCPRCQSQFSTQDDFTDHLRSADICPLVETPLGSQDPEDGIDEAIVKTLRSKKGRVSDPVEVQWQKIWELLFPGTPVQPYEYCAVMEHFELYEKYRSSLPHLRSSLSRIGLGQRGLDSLCNILDNHLIGLFEQCNEEGRQKDYRNRQPKPQQSQLRPKRRSFRERVANKANRDSGVDVGMEDDEAVDGSVVAKLDGADDETPPFAGEAGDVFVGELHDSSDKVDYSGFDGFHVLGTSVFVDDYRHLVFSTEENGDQVTSSLHGNYTSAYVRGTHGDAGLGTTGGVDGGELAHDNLAYQVPGGSYSQLAGQWPVCRPSDVSFGGEPMPDLDAWVYAQQDPGR